MEKPQRHFPLVKREPPQKKSVKIWSEEVCERLRDCFDITDWETLCSSHDEDTDGFTHCITDYINFCVENTVPSLRVRCFSKNKPWVTPELKDQLNEKKRAFISGDKEELKRVQKELKYKMRQCKDSYSRKLEERLSQNNVRNMWTGLKNISGHGQSGGRGPVNGNQLWENLFPLPRPPCVLLVLPTPVQ
ncbi:hypothetical protein QTP86_011313 [Hemibagrus guttatus]|nr:hypothetical protein QTP86_011313 [Hemibagrus guttatus]